MMKTLLKALLIITLLVPFSVKASHISGSNFSYECIGTDTFYVKFQLFRDCSGIAVPNSMNITIRSGCGFSFNSSLALQSSSEVSQLCSVNLPSSTCNGGALPGMQRYDFAGMIILPDSCSNWTMSNNFCCRNTTINLIGQPNNYIDATVKNLCNNSPVFSSSYIKYVQLNQPITHSFHATDIDGDSLYYSLVPARVDTVTPVPYATGYSYNQPIPGMTIDNNTGVVNFTPTNLGNFVVAVQVCDYDVNTGQLKGCVTRDIEYVVSYTSNNPMVADTITNFIGSAILTGVNEITGCQGDSFSFDIVITDADTADSIFITSSITTQFPGAIWSHTGGNPDTLSVSWVITGGFPLNNALVFNATDNGCPVYQGLSIPVHLKIPTSTSAGVDVTICQGSQWTNLQATGGSQFTWSLISGDPIETNSASPNFNMTCTNCANPSVSPSVTSTYQVVSNLIGSCNNVDTVVVTVAPDFNITTSNDTTICSNSSANLWVSADQNFSYTYHWFPESSLDSSTVANPIASPDLSTIYTVNVTSMAGCTKQDTSIVHLSGPFPESNIVIGDSVICQGSSTNLSIDFGATNYGYCGIDTSGCFGTNSTGFIGTGTTTTYANTYPNVFSSSAHYKMQIMYLPSDLYAMGLQGGGVFNSIAFDVASVGLVQNFQNFQIKIGGVPDTDMNSGWKNPSNMAIVYSSASITITPGWNSYNFQQPYRWDGVASLIVEVCYNNPAMTTGGGAVMYKTNTGFQSVCYQGKHFYVDCSTYIPITSNSAHISNVRPNTRFSFCTGVDETIMSYQWSPSNSLSSSNVYNPTATPSSSTTYEVVVTGPYGLCSDTIFHFVDVVNQFNASFSSQSPYCVTDSNDQLMPNVGGGIFSGVGVDTNGMFSPTNAGVGTWDIVHTIASPASCANSDTQQVVVIPLPDASIQYEEFCELTGIDTLHAATPGGIWSGFGVVDSTLGLFNTNVGAGSFTIYYELYYPCYSIDSMEIRVVKPVIFSWDNVQEYVCVNDTLYLGDKYSISNNPLLGNGPFIETWSDPNGYVNSNGVFDATNVPTTAHQVSLTLTYANGDCAFTLPITVVVQDTMPISVNLEPTFCRTQSVGQLLYTPKMFQSGMTFWHTPLAPLTPTDTLRFVDYLGDGRIFPNLSTAGAYELNLQFTTNYGCTSNFTDTIYVLDPPSNDSVIQNGSVLTAVLAGGYTYQWIDCDNNDVPVPGATSQSFTPPTTGNYAVIIKAGQCSITSDCYHGWSLSANDAQNPMGITMFPNPTQDVVNINKENGGEVTLEVLDISGRIILSRQITDVNTVIDISEFASGTYFFNVSGDAGNSQFKVLKN